MTDTQPIQPDLEDPITRPEVPPDIATDVAPTSQAVAASTPPGAGRRIARGARKWLLPAVGLAVAFALGILVASPSSSSGAPSHDGHDHASPGDAEGKAQTWTCSMHPQIKLPEPGPCPICGMDLIPLVEGDSDYADSPRHVVLSDRAKTLARIETWRVKAADAAVERRLLGRLTYDETKVRTITSWMDGRIDRLFVSAIGEKVKRGQMIASLYSPEVYAAQVDLIQAKLQMDRLGSALPVAKNASEAAYESARTRLKLLGIKPTKRSKIDRDTQPSRNVAVTSKYSGTVVEQLVHEGAYVKAGTPIFRTADLSTIWAQLDAYEGDLAHIREGDKVTLVISSFPGETFKGKVAFIDPIVDPRTRTAQIRVVVRNKDGRLSPGMFADAVIEGPAGEKDKQQLIIPTSAPLFTGKRSVVYVEVPSADKPTYEVRVVQLGPRAGNVYPVVSGLKEGERVVVRGAFVLDADLQIRGGESVMTMEDDVERKAREPVRVTPKFMKGFARVMSPYLDLHQRLAADDVDGAKDALSELGKQAAGFDPRTPEEARRVYKAIGEKVAAEARQAAKSDDIETMRRRFATISEQMILAAMRFGNPTGAPFRLSYCPMAFDNTGALWLQRADEVENPYFGDKMYRCGEIRETAEPEVRLGPHALHLERPKKAAAPAGHNH